MERCPCCNARLRERSVCSRCKADLKALINSEKSAENWLAKALSYYQKNNIEKSIVALEFSLDLKKTQMAEVFRDFIIYQQSQKILALLAQKQLLIAQQTIYQIRSLLIYSQSLQEINAFSDYLFFANEQKVLVVLDEVVSVDETIPVMVSVDETVPTTFSVDEIAPITVSVDETDPTMFSVDEIMLTAASVDEAVPVMVSVDEAVPATVSIVNFVETMYNKASLKKFILLMSNFKLVVSKK